jgi:uncharacterized protein YkvS
MLNRKRSNKMNDSYDGVLSFILSEIAGAKIDVKDGYNILELNLSSDSLSLDKLIFSEPKLIMYEDIVYPYVLQYIDNNSLIIDLRYTKNHRNLLKVKLEDGTVIGVKTSHRFYSAVHIAAFIFNKKKLSRN